MGPCLDRSIPVVRAKSRSLFNKPPCTACRAGKYLHVVDNLCEATRVGSSASQFLIRSTVSRAEEPFLYIPWRQLRICLLHRQTASHTTNFLLFSMHVDSKFLLFSSWGRLVDPCLAAVFSCSS